MVEWLTTHEHPYRTLVIDTIDSLNYWIEKHLCEVNHWDSIETPGYGKGYVAAVEEWRSFLADLERLQRQQTMHVLLVGHVQIKKYVPPAGEAFDRYDLKLPDKAASLLREWAHGVFFAQHELVTLKKEGELRPQGYDTGRRIMHTVEHAGWRAKNRWCLPPVIEFDRDAFKAFDRLRRLDPAAELERLFKGVGIAYGAV